MPLYNYKCDSCDKEFEKLVSMSVGFDDQPCKDCEQPSKRIIGKPKTNVNGFILKGNDWTGRIGKG